MRRGLVVSGVLGAVVSIAAACASFATDTGSSATTDGGTDGGDASSSVADSGETCTTVLDETFTDGSQGQLSQTRAGAGAAIDVDGGAVVATISRGASGHEAQIFNSLQAMPGAFTRSRLTFTIEDLMPAANGDSIRVGCTLKLRVDPAGAIDEDEVYLRVSGTQLGLGAFDIVDGGGGGGSSMNVLALPAAGTTVSATLETVAGGAKLLTTGTLADAGTPAVVVSKWPDVHAWQVKCGIDDSFLNPDAGDPQFTVRLADVKLEICTR